MCKICLENAGGGGGEGVVAVAIEIKLPDFKAVNPSRNCSSSSSEGSCRVCEGSLTIRWWNGVLGAGLDDRWTFWGWRKLGWG